jgi:class 3 adenylate cyclase
VTHDQRKLAAILAADVVGYSRLMGRDESGTLARLSEHRRNRFEPTLMRYGGRLIKPTGDGALGRPLNRTSEIASPERFRLDELATAVLTAYEGPRRIISDIRAPYFGVELDDRSLLPDENALIASLRFEDWLWQTLRSALAGPLRWRRRG